MSRNTANSDHISGANRASKRYEFFNKLYLFNLVAKICTEIFITVHCHFSSQHKMLEPCSAHRHVALCETDRTRGRCSLFQDGTDH